jgi:hypothetical protein
MTDSSIEKEMEEKLQDETSDCEKSNWGTSTVCRKQQ